MTKTRTFCTRVIASDINIKRVQSVAGCLDRQMDRIRISGDPKLFRIESAFRMGFKHSVTRLWKELRIHGSVTVVHHTSSASEFALLVGAGLLELVGGGYKISLPAINSRTARRAIDRYAETECDDGILHPAYILRCEWRAPGLYERVLV